MKKFILLTCLLPLSVCCALAANPTVQVGGLYYEINTNGTNATVVKDQSGADKNYPGLTTATIVATVPYSGHNYDVTAISSTAFNNCPDLEEVTIPSSVTSIGNKAFNSCVWLERIYWNAKNCGAFSSSYSDHPFYNCNKINTVVFGNEVQTIPAYACYSMSNLASVTIPSSVTKIGSNAFAYCKALTSVTLPNSITLIGSYAFYYCTNLESLNIPTSLTEINQYMCAYCTKLTGIVIPESVVTIGSYAFRESAITELTVPSAVATYGSAPWKDCASLKTIVWKPVKIWGSDWDNTDFPFSGCTKVTSFTFADNVEYVPRYICYDMDLLTAIHIPSTVTQIGAYAFEYCDGLTAVELPNTITLIGNYAFYSCKNLVSLNIPTSLTAINDYMCAYCTKLTGIVIPEGVQTISKYAFRETAITELTVPSTVTSLGYAPWKDCASLKTIVWKPVQIWGSDWDNTDFPFSGCTKVTSFTFADNVEYVPRYICYDMDLLTAIHIPSTVTQIGAYAFEYCDGLTAVELPNTITLIGNYAFYSCKNLVSLNIPTSLTAINDYMCAYCTKLTGIVIPEGVQTISKYAFRETAITELTVPSTVTSLGYAPWKDCASLKTIVWKPVQIWGSDWDNTDFPFSGCTKVTSFTFADNVEYVPRYICYDMDLLTAIHIPSTVTQIGAYAFEYCDGLTAVELPNTITLIGNYAFYSCKNLVSLNIPTSLTEINQYMCAYCKKLKSIVLPEGLETINSYAFQETAITEITIPSTVTSLGYAPWKDCASLTSIVWKAKNFLGSDYSTNTHPFYMTYSSNSKVTSVTFAEGVETIPYYICYNMPNLVNLTIPSTVTRIGMSSFSSCTSLTEVVLPEGLTSVGSQAFSNCSNLTSINIPTTLNSISTRFVSGCSKLTRIDLHEGITSIGAEAFQNTGITSITLPTTLTSMGNAPFSNCKSLTSVVWKATNTTCSSATNTHPFYGCTALKNLTFSRNVTNIPNYAFYGASAMEKIVNYALTPQTISANVFTNVNKETCELWIPKVSFSLYENANVWKDFFKRAETSDITGELTESACEYYMWAGEKITESGDYIKTFISDGGQDSIVTLHVTINHASAGSETITAEDSYKWNGETYTESGDYQLLTTNVYGCDSIAILHLTITLSPVYYEFSETACDSYPWGGKTYTTSQNVVETLKAVDGRDSIVTMHLTINYSTTGEETKEAEGSYEWHGTTYTQSGDYEYVTTNTAGCDSTVTLHLTITEPIGTNVPATQAEQVAAEKILRDGQLYIRRKENTYTATGLKVE